MKKFLMIVGVLALLAWTLGGLGAWMLAKQGLRITIEEAGADAGGVPAIASLEDRLGSLERDVQALARTLGENFEILRDGLGEDAAQRAGALAARFAQLDAAVKSLGDRTTQELRTLAEQAEQAKLSARAGADPEQKTAAKPNPSAAATRSAEPAREPRVSAPRASDPPVSAPQKTKRKSFLSFNLPSTSVTFAKRQKWTVIPSLSRVGFDAKSTLHDFTGVTSKVSGDLELDLANAAAAPVGTIRAAAKALVTGIDERDTNMWANLGVGEHPEIRYVLSGLENPQVDRAKETVTATARGKMTIRGVAKDFAMPVTLKLDPSRRLRIEGEAALDLTDFAVPVPNTLGVVKMEKIVKLWIRLRARVQAVSASPAKSAKPVKVK